MTRPYLAFRPGGPAFRVRTISRRIGPDFQKLQLDAKVEADNQFTVLIGINGTGKSRLLGELARTFDLVARGAVDSEEDAANVQLSFARSATPDATLLAIEVDRGDETGSLGLGRRSAATAMRNGVPVELREALLPSRIIALTVSQFDKFPLPRQFHKYPYEPDDELQAYVYAGSRTAFGRSGATSLLYTALENLVANVLGSDRRAADIGRTFDFLGYLPRIRFRYRLNRPEIEVFAAGTSQSLDHLKDGISRSRLERVYRALRRGSLTFEQLADASQTLLAARERNGLEFELLVHADGIEFSDQKTAEALVTLKSVGLAGLSRASVFRPDGEPLELLKASSGELSILATFLSLAATIEDGALILIDEPELGLHPDWQRRYVDLLRSTFGRFTGCHYIIATHSPLILSDLPPEGSSILNLNRADKGPIELELSGQSPDYILATTFGVVSDSNFYLRDTLARALRALSQGPEGFGELASAMSELNALRPHLDGGSIVKATIDELARVLREIGNIGAVRDEHV